MCYCFPTFKDLSGFICHPFFERECKGKGRFITGQIFLAFFEKNRLTNLTIFCEELTQFFRRTAKIQLLMITANFISAFCSHLLHIQRFRRTVPFFQFRVAKIGWELSKTNLFLKKIDRIRHKSRLICIRREKLFFKIPFRVIDRR